jgi:DNA ligase-1
MAPRHSSLGVLSVTVRRDITLWAIACMPTPLAALVDASRAVAGTASRWVRSSTFRRSLHRLPEPICIAIAYLSGTTPQGRLGIGGAAIREARDVPPSGAASLTLAEVDADVCRVASLAGLAVPGGAWKRPAPLMSRATEPEQDFLVRLLFGELRQGRARSRARRRRRACRRRAGRTGAARRHAGGRPGAGGREPCAPEASGPGRLRSPRPPAGAADAGGCSPAM